jgi:hypothetical protein
MPAAAGGVETVNVFIKISGKKGEIRAVHYSATKVPFIAV